MKAVYDTGMTLLILKFKKHQSSTQESEHNCITALCLDYVILLDHIKQLDKKGDVHRERCHSYQKTWK